MKVNLRIKTSIYLTLLTVTLISCAPRYAEVPTATNFKNTNQQKLQAAAHWDVIASDLTEKLKRNINGKIQKSERISVIASENTPFTHAVALELAANLLKDGYKVNTFKKDSNAELSKDSMNIEIDTHLIEFSKHRAQPREKGILTLLTSGLWVLGSVGSPTAINGVITSGVAGYDMFQLNDKQSAGHTPRTELAVEMTISQQGQYVAISKDIYYISDSDKALYQAAKVAKMKNYQLIGSK